MLAGRRFRVEFTDEQAVFADRIGAVCRTVWNTGLEQRREYRRRGAWMNYRPQAGALAEAKIQHPWLAEVPGHCLQQTLMDLDRACRDHGTFRVHWRSGRRWAPSFRFPEGNKMVVERLNRRHGRLKLPRLGWVKFRMSRPIEQVAIRSATLTRQGRHWFVSLLVEDGVTTPTVHVAPDTAVGVDRGVAAAIATSDGELIDRGFLTSGERRRALALQRKLSRAARRGCNRDKARAALAEIRTRERHRRQDFNAQTAVRLVAANAVVVIEDLKTKNMTRSAKGTLEQPGRNVRAKSGLNRAILAKGWHQFALALSSAARYTGTAVVAVPAAFTSQRCSSCGHVDRNPVRAKRYSGAPHAPIASTRMSTPPTTFWPQGLRSLPVKTNPDPRAGRGHRSRNQQETARNYCSSTATPHQRRDHVGIPQLQPWGGRQ